MKILRLLLLICAMQIATQTAILAQTSVFGALTVKEQDGSPRVTNVSTIEMATGITVTNLTRGTVRITVSGSGTGSSGVTECTGDSGTDTYHCTPATLPDNCTADSVKTLRFIPDVNNTGASSLSIAWTGGDCAAIPIYDNTDGNATSNDQLVAGLPYLLSFCAGCNSASGAYRGNFAAEPASATWGAIGGTLSDQTDLNDKIAAESIDNLGATAPIERTGDDYECSTCVVKDGSGNVTVTGDLTVDGDVIAGGGGPLAFEITWLAGLNISGSPSSGFALPAANFPAPTATTGGTNGAMNTTLAFDGTTDESVYFAFVLPSDWDATSAIDALIKWRGVATTGEVTWGIQTSCTADAEVLGPAFNTASIVADTAKGTTLQMNNASIAGITATGCAAGEILQGRLFRDANAGEAGADDDFSGDAFMYSMTITVRRQL